ncbi:MFS transporter [Mangrovibrevibacter kandeliae]|uniref:MFS transporter n=1 Tax=Mangrovibrevibacter kandeliae TaxID=2968473 RepID=UPI00211752FA|nr:MFS transporter [Aurantimonas sp. CSK15Z-1]
MTAVPGAPGAPLAGRGAYRNAYVLAAAQAVVGAAAPVTIASGGLAGLWLLGDAKDLATLPVTGFNLGVALGALPAAALMRAIGRRYGLMAGALVTGIGGLAAALSLFAAGFWPFAASLMAIGFGAAFVQQYRFAALDGLAVPLRPRAVSIVLTGGLFSAVIGPQLVRLFRDAFLPIPFAGAFAGLVALSLAGVLILSLLRVPEAADTDAGENLAPARPLGAILRQPHFVAGLVCAVGSYALMSFVMTGAPLAIVGCGLPVDVSFLGIQWHVLAMFAPSFVTGRLIQRFGKHAVIATGLVLIAASATVSLSGLAVWNFWVGLILLGLGWNFGFIGSTALVAESYRASEKSKAQGFHDFVLFGSVAAASFLSGRVLSAAGWAAMNLAVYPIAALCLVVLAAEYATARRRLARAA